MRGTGRRWIAAIAALVATATASIGYVLSQQHLSFPWSDTYEIEAEFAAAAGLEPGLGQPVNVAGVRVGTIRDVGLREGRAVARLEIERDELPRVWRDARAVLIPTTALKDLRIDVVPGSPAAGELPDGGRIPIARTTPPLDADDLLSALDADTRELFGALVAETDRGLDGRGADLRELLRRTGPTARQLGRVTRSLTRRRAELRRVVGNLALIAEAVGREDADVLRAVEGAHATVEALAAEQASLERAVAELPPTLETARRTLRRLPAFGDGAQRALQAVDPVLERLPAALDAVAPLLRQGPPILRERVRPLVRAARPVARDLRVLAPKLDRVTPYLSSAFEVLTYAVNELGFNPPGDDEGLLYWVAWATHNVNSVMSSGDAHGGVVRSINLLSCASFANALPQLTPALGQLLGGAAASCPQGEGRR